MKKHAIKSFSKKPLDRGYYTKVDIVTYCGKEFANVDEAIANNVKNFVERDDESACKTCRQLHFGYKEQREMRQAAKLKPVF